jgi:hypothetical protein
MAAGELQQLVFDQQQQQQHSFSDQQHQPQQQPYPDRRYDDYHNQQRLGYRDPMQFDRAEERDRPYRDQQQRLVGGRLGDQQAARLAGNLASPPWRARKLDEGDSDLQSLDQSQHRVSTFNQHFCIF